MGRREGGSRRSARQPLCHPTGPHNTGRPGNLQTHLHACGVTDVRTCSSGVRSRLSGGAVRDNWRYLNKNKTDVQVGGKSGGRWSAAVLAV